MHGLEDSPKFFRCFFRISPNKSSGRWSKHETAQAVRWVDFSFSKWLRFANYPDKLEILLHFFLQSDEGFSGRNFGKLLGREGVLFVYWQKDVKNSVFYQLALLQLRPFTWLPIMASLSLLNSSLKQAPIPGTRTGVCRNWRSPFSPTYISSMSRLQARLACRALRHAMVPTKEHQTFTWTQV